MSLIRWSPFSPSFPFDEDSDRMMREFFRADDGASKGFIPAVDIYQTPDMVIVEAPLPGIEKENLTISVEDDVLTIKGSTEKKSEVEEKNYWRKEVRSGSFYRQVALPAHVSAEQANAHMEHGILRVELPKTPEVKAKTIEVKMKD